MSEVKDVIVQGLWKNNSALVQLLGMCPLLAVTSTATNALGLGLATTLVLTLTNLTISSLRRWTPAEIRIPIYVMIIASVVSVVQMLINAYAFGLYQSLGIFIPLIVTNCIVVGRAEAFAAKKGPALSALDGERLSAFGRKMAALGNEPRLAAMLAAAQTDDEAATAAKLAAILEEPPRGGLVDLGAVFSRQQANWQQRAQQLMKRLARRGGQPDAGLMAGLLASAFADRIARRRGQEGRYQLANGMGAMLDADDALGRHEWLIAPLLLQGSASPDARMLLALPVEIGELIAARPELAKSSDTVEWDEAQGTLKAWRRTVIGQLVIKTQPLAKPSEAELHQAMLNGIREKGLGVLNWTPEAEQLRLRLHCAAQWLPEEAWPAVDDASLLASLEAWLLPQMNGVHSLRALKALDLRQALQDWLPWPLRQKLDRELPTHYTVPTGSRLAIRYHAENPPALAVRMQEMFGEATTPVIAEGRVPLVLELLSPAQRPLQITRDLSAFWQGSYREVQKEMKGRYPKHVWPDDPANAAPTRRSKKYS